jgi:hypothetical protein
MQVSKLPPADVPTGRTATAPNTEQGSQSPAATPAAVDRADIRPLDVQGALQILVAEVRASLEAFMLAALVPVAPAAQTAPPPSASVAAQQLLELFLRALPQEPGDTQTQSGPQAQTEPQTWLASAARAEDVLRASAEAALQTISAWRDVPPAVVETGREAHTMLQAALAEDPQNPVWLRPEWLGLAPRLQRFWRRRRQLRRRLSDPDYPSGQLDDSELYP